MLKLRLQIDRLLPLFKELKRLDAFKQNFCLRISEDKHLDPKDDSTNCPKQVETITQQLNQQMHIIS